MGFWGGGVAFCRGGLLGWGRCVLRRRFGCAGSLSVAEVVRLCVGLCVQAKSPKAEGAPIVFVIDQGGFVKDANHCFARPVSIGLLALHEESGCAVGGGMLGVTCLAEGHQRPRGLDGLRVWVIDIMALKAALIVFAPSAVLVLVIE